MKYSSKFQPSEVRLPSINRKFKARSVAKCAVRGSSYVRNVSGQWTVHWKSPDFQSSFKWTEALPNLEALKKKIWRLWRKKFEARKDLKVAMLFRLEQIKFVPSPRSSNSFQWMQRPKTRGNTLRTASQNCSGTKNRHLAASHRSPHAPWPRKFHVENPQPEL